MNFFSKSYKTFKPRALQYLLHWCCTKNVDSIAFVERFPLQKLSLSPSIPLVVSSPRDRTFYQVFWPFVRQLILLSCAFVLAFVHALLQSYQYKVVPLWRCHCISLVTRCLEIVLVHLNTCKQYGNHLLQIYLPVCGMIHFLMDSIHC